MNISNTEILCDDEDDMPAELRAVTDAINALMGGSAKDLAMKQLGPDQFVVMFDGSQMTAEDLLDQLSDIVGDDEVTTYATNAANVFGPQTSKALH